MTPTPEQVAQWAREAGMDEYGTYTLRFQVRLIALVTRAMAEQAEADAKLCDGMYPPTSRAERIANELADHIRTNAPKVTT